MKNSVPDMRGSWGGKASKGGLSQTQDASTAPDCTSCLLKLNTVSSSSSFGLPSRMTTLVTYSLHVDATGIGRWHRQGPRGQNGRARSSPVGKATCCDRWWPASAGRKDKCPGTQQALNTGNCWMNVKGPQKSNCTRDEWGGTEHSAMGRGCRRARRRAGQHHLASRFTQPLNPQRPHLWTRITAIVYKVLCTMSGKRHVLMAMLSSPGYSTLCLDWKAHQT